jgi:hypothetical protein
MYHVCFETPKTKTEGVPEGEKNNVPSGINPTYVIPHTHPSLPCIQAGLTEEERRTAQLLQAEFESSGIHLPAADREEVRALLNEVTALETQFSGNVIMKRTGFQVHESELRRQLPPDVIRSVVLPHQPPKQPPGVLTLTTDAAVSNAVLRCVRVCVRVRVRVGWGCGCCWGRGGGRPERLLRWGWAERPQESAMVETCPLTSTPTPPTP